METLVPVAIDALEALITNFPAISAEFQSLFASGTPTAADFATLRAKVASESYANLVPASCLPPDANDAAAALQNAANVPAQVTAQAPATGATSPAPSDAPAPTLPGTVTSVPATAAQQTIHIWQ